MPASDSSIYLPVNWSQFFPKSILPTTFLPISTKTAKFFLQDSMILPSGWFDLKDPKYYTQPPLGSIELPKPVPGHKDYEELQLVLFIKETLLQYETSIYPKFDHLSPSDCLWLMPDHTIRCYTPQDVFLLLTGSTKILEYLKDKISLESNKDQVTRPFSILPANFYPCDTTTIENINVFKGKNEPEKKPTFYSHSSMFITLRKWFTTIHPSESFRVVIFNDNVLSISQRDGLKYEFSKEKLTTIMQTLTKFTKNTFVPNWKKYINFVNENNLEESNNNNNSISVVIDVYISTKTRAVRLLDVSSAPDILLEQAENQSQYFSQNDQNNNPKTKTDDKLSKYFQSDIILFDNNDLINMSSIHSIQPVALTLLKHGVSNIDHAFTPMNFINYLTTTYINSIPLSVHLTQLVYNLFCSIIYLGKFGHNDQNNNYKNQFNSISHPLYSYLLPQSLPYIPSSNCLTLRLNYIYAPDEIPDYIMQIWNQLQLDLPADVVRFILQNDQNESNDSGKDPQICPFLSLKDNPNITNLFLTINTTQPDIEYRSDLINASKTIHPHHSLMNHSQTDSNTAVDNSHNVGSSFDVKKPTTPNSENPLVDNNSTRNNNNLRNPNDYTDAIPFCHHFCQFLFQKSQNIEFLGYLLIFLQFIFSTQNAKDMKLNKDFLQNESLQKVARITTKVVEQYQIDTIILNQDGLLKIDDVWIEEELKYQKQQRAAAKQNNHNETATEEIDNETKNALKMMKFFSDKTFPKSTSVPLTFPTPVIHPSSPQLPNLIHSNNLSPLRPEFFSYSKRSLSPNPSTSSTPLNITNLIDYPSYIVVTEPDGNEMDVFDDKIVFIQNKSTLSSSPETTPETAPNRLSTLILDSLLLSQIPISFRYTTEFTQAQEDQRVTVAQEASRLPHEDASYGIDVSSAEGIAAFAAFMSQMNGDYSSDEDYSNDEE
jgi:hypothetical protein